MGAYSCNDASNVAKAYLPCCSHSASVVPTQIHREPANDDGHGRIDAHGDQEKRSILKAMIVMNRDEDPKAHYTHTDWKNGESEAVFQLVAEEGNDHGESEGGGPWRNCV